MDMDGMIYTTLDPVYAFINTVYPAIKETGNVASEEIETETATKDSRKEFCNCRNRDSGSCKCGRPRDPAEIENDLVVLEPIPKVNKIEPADVLDIQTPFDPEIQGTSISSKVDHEQKVDREPLITFEPVSIRPNPNVPLGTGEFPFYREVEVPPPGQIAVEFLPFLPKPLTKRPAPPIFRWAAIIRHNPSDPPLKTAAQRRQIFQAAIKKVPYSRATRGREYQDRGIYEWKTCLGYVFIFKIIVT